MVGDIRFHFISASEELHVPLHPVHQWVYIPVLSSKLSMDTVRLLELLLNCYVTLRKVENYVPSIRMIAISGLCHPDQVASYAGIVAWTLGV